METKGSTALEEAINSWKVKEERFKKIFSFDMSNNRRLQLEKLHYFKKVAVRFGNIGNPSDSLLLVALRQECRALEKQIYPNRTVRTFIQLVVNPITDFIQRISERRIQNLNRAVIMETLGKMGLAEYSDLVLSKMKHGNKELAVPISKNIGDNRNLDIELRFEHKDCGGYELVSNQLNVSSEQERGSPVTIERLQGTDFDTLELYNLMEGRPVQNHGKWYMLDMSDRDVAGNFRLKEVCQENAYDLSKPLKDLSISEMRSQKKDDLIAQLSKGQQVQVTIRGKKFIAEANPQFRNIKLFDLKANRISPADRADTKTGKATQAVNKKSKQRSTAGKVRKST